MPRIFVRHWLTLAYAVTGAIASFAMAPLGAQTVPPWQAAIRSGDGAARWLAAHEFYRKTIVDADPRIVLFGDSIVERFATVGARAFRERLLSNGAFLSGISGDTTQNALWRIDHGAFDDVAPRTIVVLIGTNDLPDFPPSDVARGIVTVVERLRTHLPSADVLLVGILPRDDGALPEADGAVVRVNALLAATAFDAKVRFLNVGRAFVDERGFPSREALADGLHPSALGYERLAAAIDASLAQTRAH